MSWFSRIFGKDDNKSKKVVSGKANVQFMNLNYDPKIMMAWVKALEGEVDFDLWLLNNGFEELYHTNQALRLKQEARDWLMKNGYPHLMAMVNAAEGNESALHWLKVHGFELLHHIAAAVDDEMESFEWLKTNSTEMIFLLTRTIKKLKDEIEFNHNDIHSFGKDV